MRIPEIVKIFIVVIISLILSSLIFKVTSSPDEFKLDISQIKEQISQAKNSIFAKFQTKNLVENNIKEQQSSFSNFKTLPTSSQKKPVNYPSPTKSPTSTFPTSSKKIPTLKPTTKPTTIPTPTQKPIGIQRPGTSYEETLKDVAARTCVPTALLKAILEIESGGRLSTLSSSEFFLFNRYDWWNEKTTTLSQVCRGIAYNHHTGLVPSDAQYAGSRCFAAETFSTDVFSLGFISISQYEEDAYRSQLKNILKIDQIDRRVIFDTMMIAGLHFKNISTYRGDDCNDWEAKYIAKTACKYHGGCPYGGSGNYCQEVCDNYNRFTSGKKADCTNVSSLLDSQCMIK